MKRFIILITLLVCFTGCAVTPAPKGSDIQRSSLPEQTTVPDSYASPQDRGNVDDGWLDNFDDAELRALVDEALKNNLDLQTAKAGVERATAQSVLAGAALKPMVGYGAEVSGSTIGNEQLAALAGDSKRYNVGLGVSWELDVWGRIRAGTAAAEESLQATQSDYEFARQSIAAAVAKAWFICIETKLQSALADDVVAIMDQTFELVKTRHEVGRVSMQDVHLAEANLSAAKSRREQTDLAVERAQRSLELLLGRYPSAEMDTADDLPAFPGPLPAGLPSQLLERRPDLQAAERRVAAAFYLTQQAELARLPRFSLSAVGAFNNLADTIATLGAGVFGPLYTGGALEAQVDIATAGQKAAMASYGQQALVAFREVENSLSSEKNLASQYDYLKSVEARYRDALKIARAEYIVGKADLLSVLIMQGQWIGSSVELINIRNQRLLQRIDLHLALGGSFDTVSE